MMKRQRSSASRGLVFLSMVWAALLLFGCQTHRYQALPEDIPGPAQLLGTSDRFRVGDAVLINFSGTMGIEPLLAPHREAVKEDGTITPPLVGAVVALNKTPGELQKELQEKYRKYFKSLTVTVITADRYYYVSGEVRKPGPQPYLGVTDIVKAISAAGDFTDFSNKRSVRVIRANGQTEIVNVGKIIRGKKDDVPIYPGDKIVVKRRWF